ncbi:hypothetical protein H6G81_00035 [Scytonema hofmannii FACHB-248]|uniref:Uncharacterized protein n=1 Tax=Scytonema hofmannii FACHB-248 TaxID=1842502 RepID=A0ABR8GHV1_9CYAN|nr:MULTISPECIES: hypothetical protein [Nostocales]MBD2602944.1 hypothetical protein [Scytonema hofmannii FACHB-248]
MRSHSLYRQSDRTPQFTIIKAIAIFTQKRSPLSPQKERSPFSLHKSDRSPQSPIKKAIALLPTKKAIALQDP